MHPAIHLLAPILVLLPAANAVEAPQTGHDRDAGIRLTVASEAMSHPASGPIVPLQRIELPQQVSIEQRVTIRIAPRPAPLAPMLFDQNAEAGGSRFIERKYGKCLPMNAIAGVQAVSGRKLLLMMRDQRMFTAELKKGCQARDFYSGFLVARSADGMICKERDELRARSGATCQIDGFRQIVELEI